LASHTLAKLVDTEPWMPFQTWLDFEVGLLAHETNMNKNQTATFLQLIHRCIDDPALFMLKGENDLEST